MVYYEIQFSTLYDSCQRKYSHCVNINFDDLFKESNA